MSPSSPSFAQRKYGSVHEDAAEDHFAPQPSSRLLGNTGAAGAGQQRHGSRWRGLAALTLGAAVVGFAYNRQTLAATPRGSDNKAASLAEVVKPASAAKDAPTAPVPFPKVQPSSRPAAAQARPVTDEIAPLSFEALNFYHVRDGKPGQDYPWLKDVKLIEPHRETTLSVSSPRDGYEYLWEVRGSRQGTDELELRASAAGAEAVVILTVLDENTVTLREVNADGETVRQLDEVVMVKYVRREIRTLTDEEREELMDAMFALWDVKAGDGGKELYGDDFADIYAINRIHFKAAMNNDCDHFHDGLGFLTNHALISNTFEYSLQRVNPKLTLPYWDFTIEDFEAEKSFSDDDLKIDSPLFQEDWFGSADPVDNIVKDGRWAWTEMPSVEEDNPGELVPDVYGLLRSRWNVNPNPYLSRGMGTLCNEYDVTQIYPWPTCELHYWMATEYPDFASWVWTSMYAPHGPVHTWIGGVLNCEETLSKVSSLVGEENANSLALFAFDQRKNFWRDGFFACEGRAADGMSADEVWSEGMCGALAYDMTQGDDWETIYYNSTINFDGVLSEFDDDTKREVVAAVCKSSIYDGDHLTAGSSLDPTFWPMHPTMERLFMFSVLTGQTHDMTWPDADDTSTNTMISRYGLTCNGHGGSDVFPYGLLDTDVDGFEIKTGIKGNLDHGNKLTNREILDAMDPSVNMLSYIYDTFTWDHCLESGFDFRDAFEMPSADKRTASSKKTGDSKPAGGAGGSGPSFQENGLPPGVRGVSKVGLGLGGM